MNGPIQKIHWSQKISPFIDHRRYLHNIVLLEISENFLTAFSRDILLDNKKIIKIMKSGKPHMMEGIELSNQDKIWTYGETKTYKYLGILEADTIKHTEMKNKINKIKRKKTPGERKNYSKSNYITEMSSKG